MGLAHYILFWPALLTLLSISIVGATAFLATAFPLLRIPLLVLWIVLILTCLSTDSCAPPNSWLVRSTLNSLLPSAKQLGWKYIDRSNFDHAQQAIYIWYPHGHLGIGAFGSVACGLGQTWAKRPTALATSPPFFDIPAIRQGALSLGLVRDDELSMRACLGAGNSLVVPGSMHLVAGQNDFLRIARTMKLPIIPVFSFGENELIEELTWPAARRFFGRPVGSLRVCIGQPFMPADFGQTMAAEWNTHVSLTHELCKPATAKPLVWVEKGGDLRTKK